MSVQGDLFGGLPQPERRDDGRARRDAGMKRAERSQDEIDKAWKEQAYAAIVALAKRQETVHVDDVLREFTIKATRPNAWGSVWQRAIRNGIIKHSGRVRPCVFDPRKHLHQSPEYLSLILGRC